MSHPTILNQRTGQPIATRIVWRRSLLAKGRGLMFRRRIDEMEAHVFVESRASRANTAICLFPHRRHLGR